MKNLVPTEVVERRIYVIRGQKVMLDRDLADLYGVETRVLNQAVKRNIERFPKDFMFRLNKKETKNWISQIVISNFAVKMGLRKPPYAFTEYGAMMLASVLNSQRAIDMSVYIVRAFIKLRELLVTHKDLAQKLAQFENRLESHEGHIQSLYDAIHRLMESPEPPDEPKRRIGFEVKEKRAAYAVNGNIYD
ncbi:MAG: ORF6N domain-containing protein [Elusimicrobia bacterium]|nr:ORF6N domain-containing protein [Elusimicrobiota bacterium]